MLDLILEQIYRYENFLQRGTFHSFNEVNISASWGTPPIPKQESIRNTKVIGNQIFPDIQDSYIFFIFFIFLYIYTAK